MSASIKLPEELKRRIARVVKDTGESAHAFMLEAIREQTERAERRRQFVEEAYAARAEFQRDGKAYALEDVAAYYRAKAQGRKARKPKLRSWPR